MQRLFAEPGDWFTPTLARITPAVVRLVAHEPARTLFTRFVTPRQAEQASGRWVDYYRRWPRVLLTEAGSAMLDLIQPLRGFAPPAAVADKSTYSVFNDGPAAGLLARADTDTLVFSGVETDICVLGSVLDAVDRGYRVVIASDAVTSSDLASHEATLVRICRRFDVQIELATTEEVLAAWS